MINCGDTQKTGMGITMNVYSLTSPIQLLVGADFTLPMKSSIHVPLLFYTSVSAGYTLPIISSITVQL